MVAQESYLALTRRIINPLSRHTLADGRRGDPKSELEQFTVNAWRTPKRVFLAVGRKYIDPSVMPPDDRRDADHQAPAPR
jgi:hypothetical protein